MLIYDGVRESEGSFTAKIMSRYDVVLTTYEAGPYNQSYQISNIDIVVFISILSSEDFYIETVIFHIGTVS